VGRVGKYFSWRVARKVGEDGSRFGRAGGLGKWTLDWGGRGGGTDDAGVRSGGADVGSASGSGGAGCGVGGDFGTA
jgi:hypothetical protein